MSAHGINAGKLTVEKMSPGAKLPTQSNIGDLGYDLYNLSPEFILAGEKKLVNTGIKVKFPIGWGATFHDRSGIAFKRGLHVIAGVIDNGYRGELKILLYNTTHELVELSPGEKIAQMLPARVVHWEVIEGAVNEDTSRGAAGFGSTGTV